MLRLEGLHAGYGPIEALREAVAWQWQMFAYGVVLVLFVFFLPRGLVPAIVARAARPTRTEGGPPEMRGGSARP